MIRIPWARALALPASVALLWVASFFAWPSAAADLADADERSLTPAGRRTTDEAIARDLGLMAAWRARLDRLAAAQRDPWRAAAAQAWLEVARTEYTDGDATGFPDIAFARATSIITQLEAGAPAVTNDNLPPSTLSGDTLSAGAGLRLTLDELRRNPGFPCAATLVARLEVELAWAGNEAVDQGACMSAPHLAEAGALAREASVKAATCLPAPAPEAQRAPTAPPPAPVPVPTPPAVAPTVELPTAEEIEIPRNVHFAVNRADIGTASHDVIVRIAAVLRKYPAISVLLEGHTDSRASAAYNLELSRRRVMVVRNVFLDMEIDSTRITTDYRGKEAPTAAEDSNRGYALNRRVEMIFVDPEGHEIKASTQEDDLQIERNRPRSGPRPRR